MTIVFRQTKKGATSPSSTSLITWCLATPVDFRSNTIFIGYRPPVGPSHHSKVVVRHDPTHCEQDRYDEANRIVVLNDMILQIPAPSSSATETLPAIVSSLSSEFGIPTASFISSSSSATLCGFIDSSFLFLFVRPYRVDDSKVLPRRIATRLKSRTQNSPFNFRLKQDVAQDIKVLHCFDVTLVHPYYMRSLQNITPVEFYQQCKSIPYTITLFY